MGKNKRKKIKRSKELAIKFRRKQENIQKRKEEIKKFNDEWEQLRQSAVEEIKNHYRPINRD